MKSRSYGLGVPLFVIGVLLASGCNGKLVRGELSQKACPGGVARVDLPPGAYAWYPDRMANSLGQSSRT